MTQIVHQISGRGLSLWICMLQCISSSHLSIEFIIDYLFMIDFETTAGFTGQSLIIRPHSPKTRPSNRQQLRLCRMSNSNVGEISKSGKP